MKTLLDAMYPPLVAEQLGRRGHDIIAARALPHLQDLSDRQIIAFALRDQRVIITENTRAFLILDRELREEGAVHGGVTLVSDRSYPRRHHVGVGRLVLALDAWLREHPEEASPDSLMWWL